MELAIAGTHIKGDSPRAQLPGTTGHMQESDLYEFRGQFYLVTGNTVQLCPHHMKAITPNVLPVRTRPVLARLVDFDSNIWDVAVKVDGLIWHTTTSGTQDYDTAMAQAARMLACVATQTTEVPA